MYYICSITPADAAEIKIFALKVAATASYKIEPEFDDVINANSPGSSATNTVVPNSNTVAPSSNSAGDWLGSLNTKIISIAIGLAAFMLFFGGISPSLALVSFICLPIFFLLVWYGLSPIISLIIVAPIGVIILVKGKVGSPRDPIQKSERQRENLAIQHERDVRDRHP